MSVRGRNRGARTDEAAVAFPLTADVVCDHQRSFEFLASKGLLAEPVAGSAAHDLPSSPQAIATAATGRHVASYADATIATAESKT